MAAQDLAHALLAAETEFPPGYRAQVQQASGLGQPTAGDVDETDQLGLNAVFFNPLRRRLPPQGAGNHCPVAEAEGHRVDYASVWLFSSSHRIIQAALASPRRFAYD